MDPWHTLLVLQKLNLVECDSDDPSEWMQSGRDNNYDAVQDFWRCLHQLHRQPEKRLTVFISRKASVISDDSRLFFPLAPESKVFERIHSIWYI